MRHRGQILCLLQGLLFSLSTACVGGFADRDAGVDDADAVPDADANADADHDEADGADADRELDAESDEDADGDGDLDAEMSDADVDAEVEAPCGTAYTSETIAIFAFEPGQRLEESRGRHGPLELSADIGYARGPASCGEALALDGTGFVFLPHAPTFDSVRAVDFWLRVPEYPTATEVSWGVLSRDALGSERPGHLTLYLTASGRLALRLQNDGESVRCARHPIASDVWHHIMVSTAGPELELVIDGVSVDDGTALDVVLDRVYPMACGSNGAHVDLAGNDNPWAIGANLSGTDEGSSDGANGLLEGNVDNVRFSTGRPALPLL